MSTTRRKQAQEHYDHLMLVNCDSSDDAKKKYYQTLQEALREATRDFHAQRQEFVSGFFSTLPPELHDDIEKVWRERTMERGWLEAGGGTAPTVIEEHLCYPVPSFRNMRADYLKACNRRFATVAEGAQMQMTPLHRVNPMRGECENRRSHTTAYREVSQARALPEEQRRHGDLDVIDQARYEEMARILQVLPHTKGHYSIGDTYYLCSDLFHSLKIKNSGGGAASRRRRRTTTP